MNISGIKRQLLDQNISFTDRQIRAIIGTAMIATPLTIAPETLGYWSILLLAAIPVITSAIIGWDPLYAMIGKSSQGVNEEDIQQRSWTSANMGIMDRGIRLGAGLLMIYSLLTMNAMQIDMAFTLMAIPLIVTAITAWDPIYAILNINSFGSRIDVEAAEPEATEKTLAEFYEFPQRQANNNYVPQAA